MRRGGWLRILVCGVLLASCAEGFPVDPISGAPEPGTSSASGGMISGGESSTAAASTGADDPTATSGDEGSAESGEGGGSTGESCVPDAEICDGVDQDCDGTPDNGDPGAGEPCDTEMLGACAAGETACTDGAIVCLPLGRSTAETCNGEDDDCDGTADNGDPGGGEVCATGLPGICGEGLTVCEAGELGCVQQVEAETETCDGEDDDCDGAVDNGNPGGGEVCDTGLMGICAAGTTVCTDGDVVCEQNTPAAAAEICGNGLDDDCNGPADDGCGCPFDLCMTPGMPQVDGCDPCVSAVCDADPFCCGTSWDSICVGQVETVCGQADCVAPGCAHLVCDTGVALTGTCDPCVSSICAVDPFCCNTNWDNLCVDQVDSVCGLSCP